MKIKSITNRILGFRVSLCKSMANTNIIHCGFIGGQYWSMDNNKRNRASFVKWLRKTADMVEAYGDK